MKILVVAPQPFFTPRGTPFSVYYRTRALCELGHEVDLLTYGQGADVDIPRCRIVRIPALRWLGPIRVGPSMLKLFLDCLMVVWTIGLLLKGRYDAVNAHEEAVFWCRWLKPVFRFHLIHDMHSSLPQQLHNFQFTSLRVFHWLFQALERSAARAAEAVIVVCPALYDYARTLTDDHDKIVLVENSLFDPVRLVGQEPAQATPNERSGALEQWLSERRPECVLTYAGTLEVYQGIDRLLEAFSLVMQKLPEAGLLIIGGSPREVEQYREVAVGIGLSSAVYFAGQVGHEEAQRLVTLGAASISPRFAGNNTPMKIYPLMATGVPLVATRIESHTQVLDDDIAILSGVGTSELAEAILLALGDREHARSVAERARERYEERYGRDAYLAKMRRVLALVS
jgi:glycosyltransferase involved in cell wall biosynthesis